MTAYLIANIAIHDRDAYVAYEEAFISAANADALASSGGTFKAVDQSPEVVEGEWPFNRVVVIEFPSMENARDWYESTAYQDIIHLRHAASESSTIFVNGLG